jgi:hypothetical protein
MDASALINRLTAIAADHDLAADRLYRRAERGGIYASEQRSEAGGKRNDAVFLRQLAESLERGQQDELAGIAERIHGHG